ncbi:pheromone autoinducer 2 transporter [Gimesia panareensis]|uniref:Pheromone autoinducer 2 transporter n=1 Tax=Gimesia panareensis TaxID=2527978 RepID=A0A517PZG7_9PLAN|nr:AI-2E family transporter [Gimesia panareensis]QDT24774.1 pheromone autoinducer 2 transporter [Gimesia panareensis]
MHQAGQETSTESDQPGVRDRAVVRLKEHSQTGSSSKLAHAIIALIFVVILAAVLVVMWEVIFTLFLAILFGVFLNHSSRWLSQQTRLPYQASLASLVVALACLSAGITAFFFVQINQQVEQASQQIEKGVEKVRSWTEQYSTVRSVIRSTPFLDRRLFPESDRRQNQDTAQSDSSSSASGEQPPRQTPDEKQNTSGEASEPDLSSLKGTARQAFSFAGTMFKSTFGLVVNTVLILFVGLFLATSPTTYREGTVMLFPPERRERLRQLMIQLGDTLWHWLIGRFGSMLVTGIGAWLVLLLIGVPMAGTLGFITGLLTFIPNIGAAIAFILAILVALPQGVTTAALVVPAFIGLQLVESYVITPLIQKQQVSLPPALLISFQAIMGVLFGFLGAAIASPILAAGKVAIQELYVKDYLENQPAETEEDSD